MCTTNLTTRAGQGFTLLGAGLSFQKLAWAGVDCEAANLRPSGWSLAFGCGEASILSEAGAVQAALIWGAGRERCVKSLAVLEYTDRRWVQGSAALLLARSPAAHVEWHLRRSEEESVSKQLLFHVCVYKIARHLLAETPGV